MEKKDVSLKRAVQNTPNIVQSDWLRERSKIERYDFWNLRPANEDSHSTSFDWLKCLKRRIFTRLILILMLSLYSHIFGFNRGQSYLSTLVMPQDCTKMFRNLTFVILWHQISKGREQQYLFVTKSNFWLFWATFDQLLRNCGQRFGKSRATCGKP